LTARPEAPAQAIEAPGEDVVAFGTSGARLGTVSGFDGERGLGTVVTPSGASFAFHSTAIAGGSRRIAVGTRVAFLVGAAPGGAFEAAEVLPVEPESQPLSAVEDRAGGPA
jgi:cold shock CspA family protein